MSLIDAINKLETIRRQIGRDGSYALTLSDVEQLLDQLRAVGVSQAPGPGDELAAVRLGRLGSKKAAEIKPAELCRLMAHEIDSGYIQPDSLVIVHMTRPNDGACNHGMYTCMTADTQIVALKLALEKTVRLMLGR